MRRARKGEVAKPIFPQAAEKVAAPRKTVNPTFDRFLKPEETATRGALEFVVTRRTRVRSIDKSIVADIPSFQDRALELDRSIHEQSDES